MSERTNTQLAEDFRNYAKHLREGIHTVIGGFGVAERLEQAAQRLEGEISEAEVRAVAIALCEWNCAFSSPEEIVDGKPAWTIDVPLAQALLGAAAKARAVLEDTHRLEGEISEAKLIEQLRAEVLDLENRCRSYADILIARDTP